ncbi:MAG: 50S ribosomal protein L22 [Candidatus Electryonea clarkiae]|nr:50S ribosomal protein L22 [Candidatus Electryonea clarkiae]MDP8288622.1 50S ribosomal protein L22 [Candidatus Electryonea clarkiae]
MVARAKLRHLRVAPRKARLVADLIRGKSAGWAQGVLTHSPQNAALPIEKLLRSALANLMEQDDARGIDVNEAVISEIKVDEGPTLKRWQPRAMGRATRINKRTCHISILVEASD